MATASLGNDSVISATEQRRRRVPSNSEQGDETMNKRWRKNFGDIMQLHTVP